MIVALVSLLFLISVPLYFVLSYRKNEVDYLKTQLKTVREDRDFCRNRIHEAVKVLQRRPNEPRT